MEQEKLSQLFKQARELGVLDSGSLLVFRDYILECQSRIKKNEEQIQRLLGQNDQLALVQAIITPIVQKYVILQEQNDARERAAEKRRQEAVKSEEMDPPKASESPAEEEPTPPPQPSVEDKKEVSKPAEQPVEEAAKPRKKKSV